MNQEIRIATIKTTGEIFVVSNIQNIGTPQAKVACFGQICSFKETKVGGNCNWVYEGASKSIFPAADVVLSKVENTAQLFRGLIDQRINSLRNAGVAVHVTKKSYIIG